MQPSLISLGPVPGVCVCVCVCVCIYIYIYTYIHVGAEVGGDLLAADVGDFGGLLALRDLEQLALEDAQRQVLVHLLRALLRASHRDACRHRQACMHAYTHD